MHRLLRLTTRTFRAQQQPATTLFLPRRPLHTSRALRQEAPPAPAQQAPAERRSDSSAHRNFYKTHGRALFKALTLAFFTYQVVYYMWMVAETEEIMDLRNKEVKELEEEVRRLDRRRLLEEK